MGPITSCLLTQHHGIGSSKELARPRGWADLMGSEQARLAPAGPTLRRSQVST